jgi:methionine-rich copper-binding protein CopC
MILGIKAIRDRSGRLARVCRHLALPLLALPFLTAHPATAGSMPLEWNPVADPDVAGYRIYFGTSSGGYGGPVDAGNVTTYTLGNLADCSRYYVAVKAYDTSGNQSAVFSDEVVGLATPTTAGVSPSTSERGQTLTVTVSGTNFDAGATASFLDPKITVTSATLLSCTQLRLTLTIAADATLGARTVEVTNSDGSYVSRAAAFQITDATPPTVTMTVPASSATGVSVVAQPTVTFSEAMDPATITAANVALLKSDGTAVAQAAGSPSLDATQKIAKIVPASSLQAGTVYCIRVTGGASGVHDAMGTPLAATFTQSPGFTTAAPVAPTVSSTTPAAGATSVATSVQPAVTFSTAMSGATITASSVRLILADGSPVSQAAGSPSLDTNGKTARITPASNLLNNTTYRVQVTTAAKDTQGTALAATFVMSSGFTTVTAPVTPPVVSSTNPSDGVTNVPVGVQPTVTFSEALLASSVTAATVQLLAPDGSVVPQGAGSPFLDATGTTVTIVPAAPLAVGTTYRVRAIGGASGVKDLASTAMASTFTQATGFTIKNAPGQVQGLKRKDKH